MCRLSADRNLLVGIVALQMDFVTRDELIGAMQKWLLTKDRPLGEILERSGILESLERRAIEALVDQHVVRHQGDAVASLSALASTEATRAVLESLDDAEIRSSLDGRGASTRPTAQADPDATLDFVGGPPEAGQRFEILRLHDQGGLGSVFLARDLELNRNVALKMLKDEISQDAQSRARFLMEAEITGNLEHPGIVPVHARGLGRDGLPYYAMRFVKGENLKDALDRFHKTRNDGGDSSARELEFQGFLRRFLTICETVSYAHSRGVLHRDLKPRNVLLGPFGETLVVDWGLAKPMGRPEQTPPSGETLRPASSSDVQPTYAGMRLGTPAYMSPEQARGDLHRLDFRTDVYGLGATLYYILAGRAPFKDADGAAIVARVELGDFAPPLRINPSLPKALEAVCLKAMALKPEDRYPTSRALADDVERYLADQPPLAYREPLSERAGRWLRRRKKFVAAAAALLVVAGGALAWHDRGLAREKAHTEVALAQLGVQLNMTRDALRELLMLAAGGIASYPNSGPLRRELGQIVLDKYGQLVKTYPENLDLKFEIAQVHYLRGGLDRLSELPDDSLDSYEQVLGLLEPLVHDPSMHKKAVRLVIKTLIDRGTVWDLMEEPRKAEADYDAALGLIDRYAADLDPAEADEFQASSRLNRSEVYLKRGAFEVAQTDADVAVGLLEKELQQIDAIGKQEPSRAAKRDGVRLLLAMALTDRGQAWAALNEPSKAESDYHSGLNGLPATPDSPEHCDDFLSQTAVIEIWLGRILNRDPKRAVEAGGAFDEAVRILRLLSEKQPEIPFFQRDLADALLERASLRLSAGDHERATTDHASASALIEKLKAKGHARRDFVSLMARSVELEARFLAARGDTRVARVRLRQAIDLLESNLKGDAERFSDRTLLDHLRGLAKEP